METSRWIEQHAAWSRLRNHPPDKNLSASVHESEQRWAIEIMADGFATYYAKVSATTPANTIVWWITTITSTTATTATVRRRTKPKSKSKFWKTIES